LGRESGERGTESGTDRAERQREERDRETKRERGSKTSPEKDINLQNEFLFLLQGNLICRIKAKHIFVQEGEKKKVATA
jgi:hypothetical protein